MELRKKDAELSSLHQKLVELHKEKDTELTSLQQKLAEVEAQSERYREEAVGFEAEYDKIHAAYGVRIML